MNPGLTNDPLGQSLPAPVYARFSKFPTDTDFEGSNEKPPPLLLRFLRVDFLRVRRAILLYSME